MLLLSLMSLMMFIGSTDACLVAQLNAFECSAISVIGWLMHRSSSNVVRGQMYGGLAWLAAGIWCRSMFVVYIYRHKCQSVLRVCLSVAYSDDMLLCDRSFVRVSATPSIHPPNQPTGSHRFHTYLPTNGWRLCTVRSPNAPLPLTPYTITSDI